MSLRLFPLCSQLHQPPLLLNLDRVFWYFLCRVKSSKKAYSEFLHGVLSSLCVKCCANKPHPVVYDICSILFQPEVIMPTDACGSARVNAHPPTSPPVSSSLLRLCVSCPHDPAGKQTLFPLTFFRMKQMASSPSVYAAHVFSLTRSLLEELREGQRK